MAPHPCNGPAFLPCFIYSLRDDVDSMGVIRNGPLAVGGKLVLSIYNH
jgi:hypothetical protein